MHICMHRLAVFIDGSVWDLLGASIACIARMLYQIGIGQLLARVTTGGIGTHQCVPLWCRLCLAGLRPNLASPLEFFTTHHSYGYDSRRKTRHRFACFARFALKSGIWCNMQASPKKLPRLRMLWGYNERTGNQERT